MSVKYKVDFENNLSKVEKELENKKTKITYAWGLFWQSQATKIITANKSIDTGRLRASLSFITKDRQGGNGGEGMLSGSTGDDGTLVVGSNVHYANFIESGTSRQQAKPYVGPAILNYKDDYKKIAQQIMQE